MKKNTIIILDATKAQVTKAFAKQARIFGTPEYREWRAFLAENPGTEMVTKTIKKKKDKKNDAKNRTYKKMAEYISLQENDALMKEFEAQKKLSIVQKSPYRFVLNWFLDTFPELKEDEDKKDEDKATDLPLICKHCLKCIFQKSEKEFDTMEFTRNYMIGYLLLFCTTEEEYEKEEERLTGLTNEALEMEFTDQYNSLQGACPSHPLYEGDTPDLYLDF